MSAGRLNTLINILKAFDAPDPQTGETNTEYRKYHRKIPAMKVDASGGSTRRGQQVEESVRSVFTIPFIDDLSPHWRVEVINSKGTGAVYEIVSVLEKDDRRQWIELHCSDVR